MAVDSNAVVCCATAAVSNDGTAAGSNGRFATSSNAVDDVEMRYPMMGLPQVPMVGLPQVPMLLMMSRVLMLLLTGVVVAKRGVARGAGFGVANDKAISTTSGGVASLCGDVALGDNAGVTEASLLLFSTMALLSASSRTESRSSMMLRSLVERSLNSSRALS
eukprot:CAMPEP_0172941546 /NCGR_PEP_ID=MMETSP1075-20121228/224595_1 /TAXON_ID=2916 /ORGANISM="Ceratium fusus, Strain PA161109" /LENGTH=162 /DNA_ID=CAMNT_0013802959 /DNA_START=243 /DNA_END=728 /DNA_ORIENTATION=-